MKNILLVISIFVIQSNLFALKLLKEVKLERYQDKPYFNVIYSTSYDSKTHQLLLLVEIPGIIPISQAKTSYRKFAGPLIFSDKGKLLGKVGKFNSYDKTGIISAFSAKIVDDKINIVDSSKDALMIFSINKPFNYLYSVKDIPAPPWRANVKFIKNDTAFFTQTQDNVTEIKSKNNYMTHIDQYKKTAVGEIINTDNLEIKEVINIKRILSYKDNFNLFWNDKKLLKNKRIKKYLKKMSRFESKDYSLLSIPGGIGPRFSPAIFIFDNKNNFYTSLFWGTNIEYYDRDGNLLDTYTIDNFKKYKTKDISLYKEHIIKELKMKTDLREFREKYFLSSLINGFYDDKKDYLILRYHLSNDFRKIANLSNNEFQLVVYSLNKRKAISDFIPIDFIPIQFDSENRQLVGIQQRDGDIYLQFYKWEY